VSGQEGPVKGLLLEITSGQGRDQPAVTDGSGIAKFDHVPEGTWYLRADHDTPSFGTQLDVKANRTAGVVLPMRWPSADPIHVHSAAGTMRGPGAIPGVIDQPILSLELLEGVSGRVLSNTNTSIRGEFDFGKTKPGLYFIRLQSFGLVSILVDSSAPAIADKLDLSLTSTSCGLMYTDLSQCQRTELHVNKLAGHVSDSSGGAMFGAQIFLLDTEQNLAAYASTDRLGNFSFPDPLVGIFQLRIERAGFTAVHRSIYIEPTAGSSSLEIEAGFLSCGAVWAK